MDKSVRTKLWLEKDAVRVKAWIEDFDGGVAKWKESFYTIWRLQLTWKFAHEIQLYETRNKGVYVSLLVKQAFKKNILDSMEELGYRNIEVAEEPYGVIQLWDIEDTAFEEVETVVVD